MKLLALNLILLLLVSQASSLLIKFDREAEDCPELREKTIAAVFGEESIIRGNRIRDLIFRYFTNTEVQVVDPELKRLYAEGVFAEDEYNSFASILALDFYLDKMNFVGGLSREAAVDVLDRKKVAAQMEEFAQEFTSMMMGEMMELLNQGKMSVPGNAEQDPTNPDASSDSGEAQTSIDNSEPSISELIPKETEEASEDISSNPSDKSDL